MRAFRSSWFGTLAAIGLSLAPSLLAQEPESSPGL